MLERKQLKEEVFCSRREIDNLKDDLNFERKRNVHLEELYAKVGKMLSVVQEPEAHWLRDADRLPQEQTQRGRTAGEPGAAGGAGGPGGAGRQTLILYSRLMFSVEEFA